MTQGQINLEEMFASSVVARSVREGTSCDDYITLLSWWLMTRYGRTTRANCGLSYRPYYLPRMTLIVEIPSDERLRWRQRAAMFDSDGWPISSAQNVVNNSSTECMRSG